MTALLVIFLGLIGTAAQADHYQNKALNRDNIEQAASSLSSYASEAAALTSQAAHQRSPQNYQAIYLKQLSEQAAQVTQFIDAHQAPGPLAVPAKRLISDGRRLQRLSGEAADKSDSHDLERAYAGFQQLKDELDSLGGSS